MDSLDDHPVGGSRSTANERSAAHPSLARFGKDVMMQEESHEENPTLRAVSVIGPPIVAHETPAHRFGVKMAPPSMFGAIRPATKDGLTVKREWSGEVKVPSNWILKSGKLDPVPTDFPLERTHREIYRVDPCEVATRISDALRLLSIEAEYDCERAKAKCRTSDFVSFRIRLYAGGENNQPVVVEVQRRSGSGFSFMQSCRAILDAAEGVKLCQASKKRGSPPFIPSQISSMKCLQGKSRPCETVVVDSLELVLPLLSSVKRDENILGMEKLSYLTDPLKTFPAAALRVCKIIVLGDVAYSVRDDILSILERGDFASEFDPDETDISNGYTEQMRHLALVVFSNSLSMAARYGCLPDLPENKKWFVESLLPVLLEEIKCAGTRPCCAYEAACSISSLAESSDYGRQVLLDCNIVSILKEAHTIGNQQHELLANETKRCLTALNHFP